MARKKKATKDPVAEMLDNPEIMKALLKIMEAKKNETKQEEVEEDDHVSSIIISDTDTKIPKKRKLKFFDDPKIGIAEGKFDKKFYEGFQPTERRSPFKPISVICAGCGKNEKISQQLYSSEHSYYCSKCTSKPKGRSSGE